MPGRSSLLPLLWALAACHGREPRAGTPTASAFLGPAAPIAATPSAGAAAQSTPTDTAGESSAALSSPRNPLEAKALLDCGSPRAEVILPDDRGPVFDNAMTTPEAGHGDRTRPVLAALREQLPAFRCCFEPWAETSPQEEARVILRIALDADGRVTSADTDARRTTIDVRATLTCLGEAARRGTFPSSPSKRATLVEYPLRARLSR